MARGKVVRNGRELTAALSKIGEDITADLDQILRKLAMDAFRDLVRVSAIDTGFLKSRWSVDRNRPKVGTVDNPGGKHSPAIMPSLRIKWGDRLFLHNNAEYAYYLEHGTARQRAQPMVGKVAPRVESEAKRVLKALSKKRIP